MSPRFGKIGHRLASLTGAGASLVWPVLGFAQSSAVPLAGARAAPANIVARSVDGVVRVDLSANGAAAQPLTLPRGKSAIVELPVDARDVLVTNPAVADAVLRSPRRIYVMGVATGQTDAVFFDAAGRRILSLDIRVSQDTGALNDILTRLLPGSTIKVEAVSDSVVLTGLVANAGDAEKAQQLAERYVAKPEMVVNMLAIAGKEQVLLKVRVVEMQRNIIKQLGFNMNAVTGQLGMPQYSIGNAPSYGVNGSFLGGGGAGYGLNTTSQPVSTNPFTAVGAGAGALAQAAGVNTSNLSTVVGQFLTGAGTLSAAQQTFSQTFLSGLVGSVQTQVTPVINPTTSGVPYTVTAATAGISTGNISSLEQAYLNGGAGLTSDQKSWLTAFNTQLPAYYNTPSTLATTSTYVDRSNPADFIQKGVAGATGLNQAQAMMQAFERVGLVRTLAEPSLTAISGESAKFLAGGEYPVPASVSVTGQVSVEFKPYGVGLGFTPVVLSDGRISLKISTEVSELSTQGAFTVASTANTPGYVIPALKVRRAETTVELPSGGAMMIAGLMQQETQEDLDSLPGLASLPVIGALFRSRDYLSGETELVVIVTPYLVKSTSPDKLQTPVDGLQTAGDMETDLLGKLNKTYKAAPAATTGQTYQGPYGYVIE